MSMGVETETVPDTSNVTKQQQCDKKCDNNNSELTSKKFVIGEYVGIDTRDESKQKKKRRKRSLMKKKSMMSPSATYPELYSHRKDSSSSTNSIEHSESNNDLEETDPDLSFATLTLSTPNLSPNMDQIVPYTNDCVAGKNLSDFHFFSDTEIAYCGEHDGSRSTTPIKSDSEIELSRTKNNNEIDELTSSASWKWGELPTPLPLEEQQSAISDDAKQARRMSMISNVFNFMKQSKGLRNQGNAAEGVYLSDLDVEGLDPEVEALYFPPISPVNHIDNEDHESGNGTSLPHSPSSIESPKSCDSDYEEGKLLDRNRVAMSMCGGLGYGGPTDKEFDEHLIDYSEVS